MPEEIKKIELSNRLYLIVAILIGAIVLAYLVGLVVSVKNLPGNEPRYMTVNGEGKIYIVPDIAIISFGITKEGTDIPLLVESANQKMNAIIKGIKDLGVDEKDIKTTQYSLNPRYSYPEKTGNRILEGYEMNQTINVKIRDFLKIGSIYSAAATAGANVVGDLYFSIDDPEQARQQAREKAIAQAKTKAENIAKASGLKIGKLVDVNDGYYPYYPVYKEAVKLSREDVNAPLMAPDIQPGQQEINMTVTLTYRIK